MSTFDELLTELKKDRAFLFLWNVKRPWYQLVLLRIKVWSRLHKVLSSVMTATRDLCWTVMGAPVRDEDVTV